VKDGRARADDGRTNVLRELSYGVLSLQPRRMSTLIVSKEPEICRLKAIWCATRATTGCRRSCISGRTDGHFHAFDTRMGDVIGKIASGRGRPTPRRTTVSVRVRGRNQNVRRDEADGGWDDDDLAAHIVRLRPGGEPHEEQHSTTRWSGGQGPTAQRRTGQYAARPAGPYFYGRVGPSPPA